MMEARIEIYQALWHSFFGLRLTIGQALNVGVTRGLTFEDAILRRIVGAMSHLYRAKVHVWNRVVG